MNILWLSHMVPYPPKAGLIQRSYYLLRELAARHRIILLAFNQDALMASFYDDAAEGLREARSALEAVCDNVQIFEIPCERRRLGRQRLALSCLASHKPFSLRWLESADFADAVKRSSRGIDVLHVDTISLAPYRRLSPATPAVLNHHNVESHLLERRAHHEHSLLRKAYYWQESKRLQRFETRAGPEFQLHLTCSELDSERLCAVSPAAKAEVVPNGVDTEFFRPAGYPAERQTIAFVGSLGWGPNKDAAETIVAEIWPAIVSKWPEARFLLVGANPPRSALRLAGNDPRFEATGFVDDVRPYMARATVFLCPISDGGGTKLKLLNAFAMAKAVVANPVSCEGLEVVAGKHLLQAVTTEGYVAAISTLFNDEQVRTALGIEANRLVHERYGYSSIGLRLSGLYDAVASYNLSGRACLKSA